MGTTVGNAGAMEQSTADLRTVSQVRQHHRMLANMNFYLNCDSRILEFGCGSGNTVYEYRDAGFDAYGFEISPCVNFREPEDEKYFRFTLTGKPANIPEFAIDKSSYKIPFEDNFFDFIYSISTLEHVMDYDLALAEMARVLRPGGVAIHTFPSRYVLIEPHIFVPFGGAIQNYFWYLLWACLGIRNQFQDHLGPVGRAKINLHYARTGLNYLKTKDILEFSSRHFSQAKLIPYFWEMSMNGNLTIKGRLIHGLPLLRPFFHWIYLKFCTVVLWVRK